MTRLFNFYLSVTVISPPEVCAKSFSPPPFRSPIKRLPEDFFTLLILSEHDTSPPEVDNSIAALKSFDNLTSISPPDVERSIPLFSPSYSSLTSPPEVSALILVLCKK